MNDTKERIFDAAERLIAEQGYTATSLRQIISAAGVNLASVHYHFGSKEELLEALVMRKAAPVNEKRLELLDRYADEGGGTAPLEKVLEAFLLPMSEAANRNPQFVRVMGRIQAEGLLLPMIHKNFQPMLARFTGSLRQSLSDLPEEEFQWRILFMQGAMAHTMCGAPGGDFEPRIRRLIRFLAAGLQAPASDNVGVK